MPRTRPKSFMLGREHLGTSLNLLEVQKKGKTSSLTVSCKASALGQGDPSVGVAKAFEAALLKACLSGPVVILTERIGEVVNLLDPVLQERSICALYAKKYRLVSQELNNVYSKVKLRELTPEECVKVRNAVAKLGSRA